ncbi:MAG: phage Gp37/Gp68 family protein [Alphaproteobacteria bacterium]|nr:phage Gp37/Gp68 family protein [Alphaproteobacteria bacterium]
MGEKTKISWVRNSDGTQGHTFNPVWGCAKVGPGCDHCYAERFSNRFGDFWGVGKPRREFDDKHWDEPLKWNRAAEKAGIRIRVFCASMADAFDKDWPGGTRDRLWNLIKATPHLDWIIVTKRIGNAAKMLPADWGDGYDNVWLIITIVTQDEADRDIPKLLATPAKVRGLSIEPQLEHIDISNWLFGREEPCCDCGWQGRHTLDGEAGLHWVISGAESGNGRRPYNMNWARALRDQCHAADVSFFLKQTPGGTGPKGVIETPELDGHTWEQLPG